MKERIKWPAGNRLDLCIPLRKITVTEEGTQFGEYVPSQAAVVMVYLVGNYASYEYTPRIEDNKLFITDNGELKPGVYAIDVRIQEPERKLRSFRCGELEIVRETKQLALGDFVLDNNITLDADAFIFGEGPSAYEVAVRDGYTGTKTEWLESMRGKEGRGIADIVALPTGAFRILLTDGSAYVTPILKGEQGVSIVDFTVSSITSQEVICTITMSDGTTRTVNLPRGEKGEQGDAGEDGRGIQSVVMNNDYTITFSYTDGTSYTTPQALRGEKGENGQDGQDGQDGRGISSMSLDDDNHLTVSYTDGTTYTTPQSLQGERGVSITDFEQVGENATMTFFNIYYSNGNISQIGLPKGEQGDRGEAGPQGIKGDTVVLGEVGEYKLYNVAGTATDGAMTQDATTKTIAANTGYYECGTAAGTAAKVAVGDNEALYSLQKGGSIKVKMTNANAAASGVTLKIGSAAATPLYYNGEAVSASNSWEAGEVISVYYDGSNYQASNAMGGGSAVGKKRLTGKTGYVNLTEETAPAPTTSGGSSGQYRYIEYPVHEGDVIYIKGVSGGVLAYTWGLLDSTNNRKIVESAGGIVDYTQKPFVKVIPSGVDTIVINNYNTAYPNYEWYFAKKGSIGAHEILTEQYIYEDVRTLAVGKEYELNEAVKNDGNLMLKTLREVKAMNLTDEVSVGDLKSYGTGANAVTYQALKAVRLYDGNIVYSEGDYAIGRPTIISFAINDSSLSISEDTTFVITIGNKDYVIPVTSASTAESIAASIASLYVEGWSLSSNSGTVVMTSIEAGTAVVSISITDENETGVSIDTPESTDGANTLSQYDGSIWNAVTLATWAADSEGETAMWKSLSVEDLIRYCEQNSIRKDIDDSTIEYRNYTPQASEFKRLKKSGNGYASAKNRVCVLLPNGTKSVTFEKINKNFHVGIQEWDCKTYPTSLSTLNGTFANDSGWIEATTKPIRVNTHPDIANVAVLCIGAVSDNNFTGETGFLNVSLSSLAPYNTQNDLKELQKNVDGEESIILVTNKDVSEYNWTVYNANNATRGRYFINLGNYEYDSCRIKFNVKDGSPIKVGASLIYNIYDYNNYAYDTNWIQGGYGREFDLSAAENNPFRYVVFNTTYVSQDTIATTFEEFIRYCDFEVELINHTGGMKSDVRQLQKSGKCLIASTDIKIVAHRGFHLDNVPENSIDAYRWAGFLGYDLVETDFCPTSDDELVLMHDASINRTMRNADYTAISETVNVNSKTLDELRSNYVLASNEKRYRRPIPTLEEYFIACKEGGLFALPEIKNAGTTTEHVLAAYEMGKSIMGEDRFGFCSFSYALLDYARSLSDKLQLWYIGNSILNTTNTVTNQSRNTPETVWYPQYNGSHGFTAAKVKQYHALNMKVAVWNVPVEDFDKMLKANVDYIATDYVGSNLLHTEGEVYNEYDMETNGIKTEGIILPSGKYARIVGDIMEIGIYYISIISNGKYVLKAPNLSVTINDSVPTRHIFQGLIDNKNASFTITATTDSEIQFANIKVVKVK